MYRRIEPGPGYQKITVVTEDGTYTQHTQWTGGIATGFYKSTLQEMGWESVKQFLKSRPGFEKVGQ